MECEPWAPRTVERLLGSGLERPIGKPHPGAARLPVGGSSAAGLSTGHESASDQNCQERGQGPCRPPRRVIFEYRLGPVSLHTQGIRISNWPTKLWEPISAVRRGFLPGTPGLACLSMGAPARLVCGRSTPVGRAAAILRPHFKKAQSTLSIYREHVAPYTYAAPTR